ncbi:hypothetical protein [Streptosporangium amethystogenes]|uniref:hypothetical protein n=1 Tax=Streptosporangium amethystogenes TaxID=2002 RepID=UPI0004C74FC3|nr:hypothetical protein [Streptosporangium amethystogenes]
MTESAVADHIDRPGVQVGADRQLARRVGLDDRGVVHHDVRRTELVGHPVEGVAQRGLVAQDAGRLVWFGVSDQAPVGAPGVSLLG